MSPDEAAKTLSAARLILGIVAASFPLAAALLFWARHRGDDGTLVWPTSWLVCGVVGLIAAFLLNGGLGVWWWVALLSLGPILAVSLVVDLRHGHYLVATTDVAGLAAMAYGLYLAATA